MNTTNKETLLDKPPSRAGLLLSLAAMCAVLWLPLPLTEEAHKTAAIIAATVCLWITEALPLAVTGLLAPTLLIIFGVTSAQKAFAPFADPIMFLFLGAFILSRAIQLHGLDRRFAYSVLTSRLVGENPSRILFAYGATCCLISMWISNTATVAMMFPIGLAIIGTFDRLHIETRDYKAALMLICAFAASLGGLATPVGTPPNLIGISFIKQQLGRQITFIEWMSFGLPTVALLYLILFSYLYLLCARKLQPLAGISSLLKTEQSQLGRFSRGEINTLLAFTVTVVLWIAPSTVNLLIGEKHVLTDLLKHFPESVAALVGACLLFILPDKDGRSTLSFAEAVKIDWAVMALYGGGITLGHMAFETKLSQAVGQWTIGLIPQSEYGLIAVTSAVSTMISELTSNVSAANMVIPAVIAITGSLRPAVAACLAASLGFMLPISTPTNAIVYSSGYIKLSQMIKYGLLLDSIGIVVITIITTLIVPTR
ncbi:MAG: DASS family sodium-coupled anion symporter [Acidobacteriota bacterium]|nr:DASS family sodium-coupled anion symporter [Blastocatellia bacterium]MDW8412942.1 DASS family sodium-coupled anion symporter [Acidobacteriota bacterium]